MDLTVKTFSGKLIIIILLLIPGVSIGALGIYEYTRNSHNFCFGCHTINSTGDKKHMSMHENLKCFQCHEFSLLGQNKLFISSILNKTKEVPVGHGKINESWGFCESCHLRSTEKEKDAAKINRSPFHARHVFGEQIDCSDCHGCAAQKFLPEEKFCIKCHQGKTVHGMGMEELACLNCHTDRTLDLKSDRGKCLFCHGESVVRRALLSNKTLDVKYFQPSEEIINRAIKINEPPSAPMQFNCQECHKLHDVGQRDWGRCLDCHRIIPEVGKHKLHINVVGMECKQCHKPHVWRVTRESARKDCIKCHGYRSPDQFIAS